MDPDDREYAWIIDRRNPVQAPPPSRIDWPRVAAMLVLFLTAAITFAGIWVVLVWALTAW